MRVLVVDDSAVARLAIVRLLSFDGDLVVTAVADPLVAMQSIAVSSPDVILLDLEMPRMDGLTFMERMADDPIPVVVCSSHVGGASDLAMRALAAGAVDVIDKRMLSLEGAKGERALRDVVRAIRAAARARVGRRRPAVSAPPPSAAPPAVFSDRSVIAVGASTGGTEALRVLLRALPETAPPVLIVQHMPAAFTAAFARSLNDISNLEVSEARGGEIARAGRALVAPGDRHLLLRRDGDRYRVQVVDGPVVSRHRPSVDVLFRSMARVAGKHGVGVLLTGMGDDGADGLLEMRRVGAFTIAQDEATSVVFGMPREAIARGAAERVVALQRVASTILRGRP